MNWLWIIDHFPYTLLVAELVLVIWYGAVIYRHWRNPHGDGSWLAEHYRDENLATERRLERSKLFPIVFWTLDLWAALIWWGFGYAQLWHSVVCYLVAVAFLLHYIAERSLLLHYRYLRWKVAHRKPHLPLTVIFSEKGPGSNSTPR